MKNENAIRRLSSSLREQYGEAIASIILFGSVARKQSGDTSDIDVMIVFDSSKQQVDWRLEREVRSIAMPVELEQDVVFDLKVRSDRDLDGVRGHTPFMERVRSEGVGV